MTPLEPTPLPDPAAETPAPAWAPDPTVPPVAAPSQPVPASTEPPAPTEPPTPAPEAAAPPFHKGDLVVHHWEDPFGAKEALGMVIAVDVEGDEPRARLAWFPATSGLIPASQLEVFED